MKSPPSHRKLNLGCGKDIRPNHEGWINLDRYEGPGVDVVHDLRTGTLPFDDDRFKLVLASHVLEHIVNFEDIVEECWRVLSPGGLLTVQVPHAPNYGTGHVRQFYPSTLDGFIKGVYGEDHVGFEAAPLFDQRSRTVRRELWGSWHIKRYLGMKLPDVPFGEPREITWTLEVLK